LSKPLPKLTPGQRALAGLREACPVPFEEDDPKERPKFAEPNDEEWSTVWQVVRPLLQQPTGEQEAKVRSRVDNSAYLSGYFRNHTSMRLDQSVVSAGLERHERYLKAVQSFRNATAEMIGPECGGGDDDPHHDPYRTYEELISYLDGYLLPSVRHSVQVDKEWMSRAPKPPESAAKPERDLWMARLCIVWREDCGLEISHPRLTAFVLAAVRVHEPTTTSRAAKGFITRLRAGEIPEPPRHFAFK
jgi:hypothetical protein